MRDIPLAETATRSMMPRGRSRSEIRFRRVKFTSADDIATAMKSYFAGLRSDKSDLNIYLMFHMIKKMILFYCNSNFIHQIKKLRQEEPLARQTKNGYIRSRFLLYNF